MPLQPSIRLTQINFSSGLVAVAPTDQWIACLFDVLHPTQQEAILQRLSDLQRDQEKRSLVITPGHDIMNPFEKAD